MLDQRAQRIAVRRDDHRLARSQLRHDRALANRAARARSVLEALGRGDRDAGVARVGGEIEFARRLQHRRRNVEAAAPDLDLLVAVLGRGLGLVEPGEPAIVALVEPPVLGLGDPQPPARLERQMQRLDRAGLERGEGDASAAALRGEQRARGARFVLALGGQVDIPPAGEAVFQVPLALAVADEDQARHE